MPQRVSNVLGISHEAFDSEGAFDAFVDVDSLFYIDPRLLDRAETPELKGSRERVTKYFEGIIHLLEASQKPLDLFWRKAWKQLVFREPPYVGLGYSSNKKTGSGIGLGLARKLTVTASQIVAAGIKDPLIFELVGLLEYGIGADRISDMTASIIMPDLLRFSERVARNLGVSSRQIDFRGEVFELLYNPKDKKPIVLVPSEMLTPLPVAFGFDDIDSVVSHNTALRDQVNRLIGSAWAENGRVSKRELRDVILGNPDLLRDIIKRYRDRHPEKYDFANDPAGEVIWFDASQQYATRYPLDLRSQGPVTARNILETVTNICTRFQTLVQDNGLFHLLYDEDKNLKNERAAQLLFFGIADAYCAANDLDLSRETNAGRGPVDFKVSKGYQARVTVEVKYSANKQLCHGFTTQLPIYNRAERTEHSIFLIIKTAEKPPVLERIKRLHKEETEKGNRVPKVIIVDGRYMPPGSKA